MNILFRADASEKMGTGHVMRCLTLSEKLAKKGAKIFFICRPLKGNLINEIEKKNFIAYQLGKSVTTSQFNWSQDAELTKSLIRDHIQKKFDWIVVDHYDLDYKWHHELRKFTNKILVIDDMANRELDCDALLDQNYFKDNNSRYNQKISNECHKYFGPKFALLRDEFYRNRKSANFGTMNKKRIFISLGGSDPTNATELCIKAIIGSFENKFEMDVIIGESNPNKKSILKLFQEYPFIHFHNKVEKISEIMIKSDFAIGGGGSSMWERCYFGLPSLTLIIAENQKGTTLEVSQFGATLCLEKDEINIENIKKKISVLTNEESLKKLNEKSLELMNEKEEFESALMAEFFPDSYNPKLNRKENEETLC